MTGARLAPFLPLLEKLGFTPAFVETNVLARPGEVTVSGIAMLWQGMPNKHDRRRTRELMAALAAGGLLAVVDDEAGVYSVI